MDDLDQYIKQVVSPDTDTQEKLRRARDLVRTKYGKEIPDSVVQEFYDTTYLESGRSHYNRDGSVKLSPKDPKDGQRAVGWSQIKPGTIKQYNLDPYDEIQNIAGGLMYFYDADPNDPISRRIGYFSGHNSKSHKAYKQSGKIPGGGDFTGTSFGKYIAGTGGYKPIDAYVQSVTGQNNSIGQAPAAPKPDAAALDDYIKSVIEQPPSQPEMVEAPVVAPPSVDPVPIQTLGALPVDEPVAPVVAPQPILPNSTAHLSKNPYRTPNFNSDNIEPEPGYTKRDLSALPADSGYSEFERTGKLGDKIYIGDKDGKSYFRDEQGDTWTINEKSEVVPVTPFLKRIPLKNGVVLTRDDAAPATDRGVKYTGEAGRTYYVQGDESQITDITTDVPDRQGTVRPRSVAQQIAPAATAPKTPAVAAATPPSQQQQLQVSDLTESFVVPKGTSVRKAIQDKTRQMLFNAGIDATGEDIDRALAKYPIQVGGGGSAGDLEQYQGKRIDHTVGTNLIKDILREKEVRQKRQTIEGRIKSGDIDPVRAFEEMQTAGLIDAATKDKLIGDYKQAFKDEMSSREKLDTELQNELRDKKVAPTASQNAALTGLNTNPLGIASLLGLPTGVTTPRARREGEIREDSAAKFKEIMRESGGSASAYYARQEKARQEKEKLDRDYISGGGYNVLAQPVKSLVKGAAQVVTDLVQAGMIANEIVETAVIDRVFGAGTVAPAYARDVYKLMQAFDDKMKADLADDPRLKDALLLTKIPETFGQLGVQMAVGYLTGGSVAPTLLGMAQGATGQYKEAAKNPNATANDRAVAAIIGGVLASPDAILFNKWFKGASILKQKTFLGNFARTVYRGLRDKGIVGKQAQIITESVQKGLAARLGSKALEVGKSGTFETYQETVLEGKGNDLVAYLTYDKSPKRLKKALTIGGQEDAETAIVSFLSGGGGEVISQAVSNDPEVAPVMRSSLDELFREARIDREQFETLMNLVDGGEASAPKPNRGTTPQNKPVVGSTVQVPVRVKGGKTEMQTGTILSMRDAKGKNKGAQVFDVDLGGGRVLPYPERQVTFDAAPTPGKVDLAETAQVDPAAENTDSPTSQTAYGTIAADYLFTGGAGAMLSSDYLLQALSGAFSQSGSQIAAIRDKYYQEIADSGLGDIKAFAGSELFNRIATEVRNSINSTYGNNAAEAQAIFDEILKYPTGLPKRLGQQLSIRLDKLNEASQVTDQENVARPAIEDAQVSAEMDKQDAAKTPEVAQTPAEDGKITETENVQAKLPSQQINEIFEVTGDNNPYAQAFRASIGEQVKSGNSIPVETVDQLFDRTKTLRSAGKLQSPAEFAAFADGFLANAQNAAPKQPSDALKTQPATEVPSEVEKPAKLPANVESVKAGIILGKEFPQVAQQITEKGDAITLRSMTLPEALRGKGREEKYFDRLTQIADAKNKPIILSSPGTHSPEFLADYGFTKNTDGSLTRKPQAAQKPAYQNAQTQTAQPVGKVDLSNDLADNNNYEQTAAVRSNQTGSVGLQNPGGVRGSDRVLDEQNGQVPRDQPAASEPGSGDGRSGSNSRRVYGKAYEATAGTGGSSQRAVTHKEQSKLGKPTVVAHVVHFAPGKRPMLDSSRWGTNASQRTGKPGQSGQERAWVMDSSDQRLRHRIYAYIDDGAVEPGANLGSKAHSITLNMPLYDLDLDAEGIKARGSQPKQVKTSIGTMFVPATMADIESAILDAGYAGIVETGLSGKQYVVLLGERRIPLYAATEPANYPNQGLTLAGQPSPVKVNGVLRNFGAFDVAVKVARDYMRQAGLRYAPPDRYVKIDKERAKRIADEFDRMEHNPNDPLVKEAYTAMIAETVAQWQAIKATGLKVEFISGADPYGNPRNAIFDVVQNNHLWVFPTSDGFGGESSQDVDVSDNPLLEIVPGETISGRPVQANDIFRIVHDYFGHIKDGNGFRAEGEENAWQSHVAMYSPLARRAMTTETRGQNSWVNFGRFAEFNKTASAAETEYAPQKIGLLPEWVSTEGRAAGAESGTSVDAPDYRKPKTNRTAKPGKIDLISNNDNRLSNAARALQAKDVDFRISTRIPTSKSNEIDPVKTKLTVGLDSLARKYDQVKAIFGTYPGFRFVKKTKDSTEAIEQILDRLTENLLWLHDRVPVDVRDRSKLWYDGARALTEQWSKRFDLTRPQIAGVLAALSPQMDWFKNISLAERVLTIATTRQNTVIDQKMIDTLRRKNAGMVKFARKLATAKGVAFKDLPPTMQAIFLRAYDETYTTRFYSEYSPEGEELGLSLAGSGNPNRVAWGAFNTIGKALSIAQNGDLENISRQLGNNHKVRNFYNNILLPRFNQELDVTIDTHAVAAALIRPLAGSSQEVKDNLGARPKDNSTGAVGTYGLFAEAYRRAAKERGILAREMQSITWEAVRGLFSPEFKKGTVNKTAIAKLWRQNDQSTFDKRQELRSAIERAAGGITPPVWFRSDAFDDDRGQSDADRRELSANQQLGNDARRAARRRTRSGDTGISSVDAPSYSRPFLTPVSYTPPYTLTVLNDPLLKGKKGKDIKLVTIKQVLKQQNTKKIEQDIIGEVLEMPAFAGKQQFPYDAFEEAVRFKLMPLKVIESSNYAEYGSKNVGVSVEDSVTNIYNTDLEHGDTGHFRTAFEGSADGTQEWEIREVVNPNTNRTVYFTVPVGAELTEENVAENVGTATNSREKAEQWIAQYQGNFAVNKGLFGHTRVWRDGTDSYIAEIQSDAFQKTAAENLVIDSYITKYLNNHLSKSLPIYEKVQDLNNVREQINNTLEPVKQHFRSVTKELAGINDRIAQETQKLSVIEAVEQAGLIDRFAATEKALNVVWDDTSIGRSIQVKKILDHDPEIAHQTRSIIQSLAPGFNETTPESYWTVLVRTAQVNGWSSEPNAYLRSNDYEIQKSKQALEEYAKVKSRSLEATNTRQYKEYYENQKLEQKLTKQLLQALPIEDKQFIAHRKNYTTRLLREEIRRQAAAGQTRLLIPTPRTLALIEGYISKGDRMPYEITYQQGNDGDDLRPNDEISVDDVEYTVIEANGQYIWVAESEYVVTLNEYDWIESEKNHFLEEAQNAVNEIDGTVTTAEAVAEQLQNYGLYQADVDTIADLFEDEMNEDGEFEFSVNVIENQLEQWAQEQADNSWEYIDTDGGYENLTHLGNGRYIYTLEEATLETFNQPDQYESRTADIESFDLEDFSGTERTILEKYIELNDLFRKERTDTEVVTDNEGNEWLATNLTDEDSDAVAIFAKNNETELEMNQSMALFEALEADFTLDSLTKAAISPNGKLNEQAFALMSRVHAIAFGGEPGVWHGVYLRPENVAVVRDALVNLLDSATSAKARFHARRIIAEFDATVDAEFGDAIHVASSSVSPNGLKTAWQEETAHRYDFRQGERHQTSLRAFANHPIVIRAMDKLARGAYAGESSRALIREVAAKIWIDEGGTELGLTAAEVDQLQNMQINAFIAAGVTPEIVEQEIARIRAAGDTDAKQTDTTLEGNRTTDRAVKADPNRGARSLFSENAAATAGAGTALYTADKTAKSKTGQNADLAYNRAAAMRESVMRGQPLFQKDRSGKTAAADSLDLSDILPSYSKPTGAPATAPLSEAEKKEVESAFKRFVWTGRKDENTTSLADVLINFRRAGLLTAPKTHLRNLTSNGLNMFAEEAIRPIAVLADIAASAVTGQRTTQAVSPAAIAKSFAALVSSDKTMQALDMDSAAVRAAKILKYGDAKELEKGQNREMKSGLPVLDAFVNYTFRTLGAEDALFKTYAMRRSLEESAKTIALTESKRDKSVDYAARRQELLQDPTYEMLLEAELYADFVTFTNQNAVSDLYRRIKEAGGDTTGGKIWKAVNETIVPYDKTPTNIVLRVLEFSPLGFAFAAKHLTDLRRGTTKRPKGFEQLSEAEQDEIVAASAALDRVFPRQKQQQFARSIGRGTVGSAALALGMYLAMNGVLSGLWDAGEEDEKDEFFGRRNVGIHNAALQLGTRRYVIGDTPLGKVMAIGASIYERSLIKPKKDESKTVKRIGDVAQLAKMTVFEQPLLHSLLDYFGSKKTKEERLGNLLGSFVPAIAAAVADVSDDETRDNKRWYSGLMNRTPGLRQRNKKAKNPREPYLRQRQNRLVDKFDPFSSRPVTRPIPKPQ